MSFTCAKSVLIGPIYRPPDQNDFYDNLERSLAGTEKTEKIILGDFNTHIYHKEASVFKSLTKFTQPHGLSQLITLPTRAASQTTIDLILTSDESLIVNSGVITCGLSDHHMIFCTRKKQKEKANGHKTSTFRSLKTYNSESFKQQLKEADWSKVLVSTQVDEAWLGFKSIFLHVLNSMAPMITARVKARSEPWMNSDLLAAMKARDRKLSESQKCNSKQKSAELYNEFKSLRNKACAMVNKAKKTYIEEETEANANNTRELWKLLNNQLGCGKKLKTRYSNINLKSGDSIITDKEDVANHLNIFFSTIATKLVDLLGAASGKFGIEHLKNFYAKRGVCTDDFKLSSVTTDEVFKKLSILQPHKATGHDNIPPKFLRDSAETIAPIITHIINLSINQGHVPRDFKTAKITPLHKKGSKLDPGNYRPISILPSISKIMEKIIFEQVEKYLTEKKLIYEYQSGFRSSHSTDTCLLYLHDRIKHEVDSGKYCGMVMLDLQKAFDTVNHDIMIDKLKAIGFDGTSVSWMQSYLEGRVQMVEVNGSLSSPLPVTCGVPQGSILGPLLFLIYVNDMNSACDCDLFLFADDSALLVSDSDRSQVENALSKELTRICTWLTDNKLSIHLGKTESILFGSKPKLRKADSFTVKVGDNVITRKDEITYLGCILEANLSGDKMAAHVIKKVHQRTRFMYRIAPLVNKKTLKTLVGALIQPLYDYAAPSWYFNSSMALKTRLQTAQNKLVRLLHGLNPRAHLNPSHFVRLNWLKVISRVRQLALVQVFKIRTSKQTPKYLQNYFKNTSEVHNYNTRGSATNISKTSCVQTNKGLISFSFYAINMWNNLPKVAKECKSLLSFKTILKGHLKESDIRNW